MSISEHKDGPGTSRWRARAKRLLGPHLIGVISESQTNLRSSWLGQVGAQIMTDTTAFLSHRPQLWYDEVLSFGPHPPRMYDYILQHLHASKHIDFVLARDLHGGKVSPEKSAVILRHDLDLKPEKVLIFTHAERNLGVRSSIYVRVDGESYDVRRVAATLRELNHDGFEIGLHTAAYTTEQPLQALKRELELFQTLLGFEARSVNTHGVHQSRKIRRQRQTFLQNLCALADQEGFVVTDHTLPGVYDMQVGDSNLRLNRRVNYVTRSVFELAHLPAGKRGLFMTHPVYW